MTRRGRVNWLFLLIIVGVIVFATAAVAGLWVYQTRGGDATQHIMEGNRLLEEGDFERAARAYGRAVNREPSNLEYIAKYRNALRQSRPASTDAAREAFALLMTSYRQEAQYNAMSPESHLRYLRVLHANARFIRQIAGQNVQRRHWDMVADAAEDMLNSVHEDEPDRVFGYLYRGMARMYQHAALTETEMDRAEQDLFDFVEARPDVDLGWAALITALNIYADHYYGTGQSRRAERKYETLQQVTADALEAVPDGPETLTAYGRVLIQRQARGDMAISDEEIDQILDRIVEMLPNSDDPWLVNEAALVIHARGGRDNLVRAAEVYEDYLQREPDALAHRYFLAQFRYRTLELDLAEEQANKILESAPLPVGLLSQMRVELDQRALGLLFDIEHQRYIQAERDGAPQDVLDESLRSMKATREQLIDRTPRPDADPLLLRVEAKLALAQNQLSRAATTLERLIRDGHNDIETLAWSAYTLEQIGQTGAAYERTLEAIEQTDTIIPTLHHQKARLELRMGRFDDARQTVDRLLAAQPDDQTAQRLAQRLDQAVGRAAGERQDVADPVAQAARAAHEALAEGDVATARATVQHAMNELDEDDVRLLYTATFVEINAGNFDAAERYLDRALQISPESPRLQQARAVVETGDYIAATRQYVESQHDSERDRVAMLVANFQSMSEQQRQVASRHREAGRQDLAAEAETLAERASEQVEEWLARARDVAGDHPNVLHVEFTRALNAREWDRVESALRRIRDHDVDEAGGLMYEGNYELTRGRYEEAVRVFQRAVDRKPFSSQALRGLGLAYMRLGNFREAERAFERSYEANPNNIDTVRNYLQLLRQTQQHGRALGIARTTRRIVPGDTSIREAWLQLEAEEGDLKTAVQQRRRIYEEDPGDRVNAMQLALLLGQKEPTYPLILDDDGESQYSAIRWRQLNTQQQRQRLNTLRDQWREEADQIVSNIIDRYGKDIETVLLQATLLRSRGQANVGEQHVREYIAGLPDERRTAEKILALSQYQMESGDLQSAFDTIQEARRYQQEGDRSADLALARFLFTQNRFEQALAVYDDIIREQPDRSARLQAIECLTKLGRHDEAAKRLDALVEQTDYDFTIAMLRATISMGQAEQAMAADQPREAERKIELFEQSLASAEQLIPSNPAPFALRAQRFLNEFRRTGRTSFVEDALTELDRAEAVRPHDQQVGLIRAEALRLRGSYRRAATELNRILERHPDNAHVRRQLIRLHLDAGDIEEAIASARRTADRYPTVAAWHEMLGELTAQAGRFTESAEAFRRAWQLTNSQGHFRNYVSALLSDGSSGAVPPDEIVRIMQRESEMVLRNPALTNILATAQMRAGRNDAARQSLKRSYERMLELIERGEEPPGQIATWYRSGGQVISQQPPQDVEQLVLELTGNDPSVHDLLWLGRLWRVAGQEGISRSIELFQSAERKAEDEDPQLRGTIALELGNTYLATEQWEPAVEALKRTTDLLPEQGVAHNNLAFILTEHFDRAEAALPHAERAYELLPDNHSVLDTLGWVYHRLGRHEDAREYLRRSLEVSEQPRTHLHLAHALLALGEYDRANTHLRRASEMRPDQATRSEIDRLSDDIRTRRAGGR